MAISESDFKQIVCVQADNVLLNKLRLGDWLCALLYKDFDPRAPEAIRRLRQEQRWIMDVQQERIRAARQAAGIPEPPDQIVGMRSIWLCGRASGVTGGRDGKFDH